jgi:hypothetical protein
MRFHISMRPSLQTGLLLLAIATATITEAQDAPSPQQFPRPRQMHGPQSAMQPAMPSGPQPAAQPAAKPPAGIAPQAAVMPPSATPQTAPSLLDEPAKPAQVRVADGKLAVDANNSTLSDILHDISAKTGMTVDGLSRDQRVFGNYGPASPREVLSALLDGMGYNIMMVGSLDTGVPRQLVLTQRTAGGAAGTVGGRPMQSARQNNGDDDDDSTPDPPDVQQPRPEPNPPEATQPPPSDGSNNGQPGQVKTPQQMLQELQQIRQQQQQQAPTNPQ